MKLLIIALSLILGLQNMVSAFDPTKLDGAISVKVDRSKEPWVVTIINNSEDDIEYEMMGRVPRGLGIELWENGTGQRIHAEGLAKSLNLDGFPADIRMIRAKSSKSFSLNPKSMSAETPDLLKKWEEIEKSGIYSCRVFFGVYASRLFDVDKR